MPVSSYRFKIELDSKGLIADAKRMRAELEKELSGGGAQAVKTTGEHVQRLGRDLAKIAGIAVAFRVGQKATRFLEQATQLAARVETLGVSLAVVGRNAGYSAKQIAEFEEEVKAQGITTQASRQALLQMAQAEIEFAHAADLARVAQDAAVIANINSSEAFQRLTTVIQTGNVLMGRRLGLQLDFQGGYDKMAAQVNKTVDELDKQEKTQARVNVVMQAGEHIAGTYEAAMGTAGKQALSLARHIEEITRAVGKIGLGAFSEGIQELTRLLKDLRKWIEANEDELEDLGESVTMLVEAMVDFADLELPVEDMTDFVTVLTTLVDMLAIGIEKVGQWKDGLEKAAVPLAVLKDLVLDFVAPGHQLIGIFRDLGLVTGAQVSDLREFREANEDLFKTEKRLNEERAEGLGALYAQSDALRDLRAEMLAAAEASTGMALFTEAEFEAIDQIEDYLRRRNDLIQEHNNELADMEQDFLDREADHYQDYLDKRAKLEDELRQVAQDPLWQMTRDVQRSEKRIADAIEDYNKRIADAIEDHQRKLRNLREGHDDKMEDLEARRDAKGIISERRRYGRALRDANEHHTDLVEGAEERKNETIETEREKIETTRRERKEDLEEKLRELDENYIKEQQKRQDAYNKAYADRELAQARELEQLERAHGQRLAKIMGWETQVRLELQRQYLNREGDLRMHLARMRALYAGYYGVTSTAAMSPEEARVEHERIRGHQLGGYAGSGLYRLGEAGEEYVLNAPTTRALERAIGHLSQAKILGMAGGASGGHLKLDVHVTADDHFSPAFESMVRKEIVDLSVKATRSRPGAYRPH